jgi:hypothetical protein
MQFLGMRAFTVLLLCSSPAISDELISKNWISSQEDWYLIEDSIKKSNTKGVYLAQSYLSKYKPNDKLEVFDSEFNVVGYEHIGTYQSYGYVTAFDCSNGVAVELAVRYYSGKTPHGSKVVWEEYYEADHDDFGLPRNEDLFARVCALSAKLD